MNTSLSLATFETLIRLLQWKIHLGPKLQVITSIYRERLVFNKISICRVGIWHALYAVSRTVIGSV